MHSLDSLVPSLSTRETGYEATTLLIALSLDLIPIKCEKQVVLVCECEI